MMLLLVAAALILKPAVARPHHTLNLERIYDLVEKCTTSSTQDFYVEDVSHLTEGTRRCEDKFFCKVHDILHKQKDFCKRKDREDLVRTLMMYNTGRNVKCEKTLQGMTSTGDMITFSRLLEHLKDCVKQRNSSEAK